MTINSETRVAGPFDGNDSTTSFPFTFKVFDSDEVRVVVETGAVETDLELGTDYTVILNADQNAAPGGSVLLVAPLATGTRLTLTSALEMLQPVDLTNQGGFYPRVINSALDRLTILLQQLASVVGRTLKFPLSDGPVGDLPGRSVRAGTVLAFDEATGEPVAGPDISSVNGVAGALAAISTVADNVADVNTVADNIVDVSNFADVYYGPSTTDPTTRRDGSPLQAGDLYLNTASGTLRSYDGVAWRGSATGTVSVQNLSGDGVQTQFQLNYAPESETLTSVFVGGIYQQKNTYELGGAGGDVLIFDVAPPTGTDNIEVVVSSLTPSDDRLRLDLADASDVAKGAALVGYDGATVADALAELYARPTGTGVASVSTVSTVSALRGKTDGDAAVTLGYWAAGDGGHGLYRYDAADTSSADNGCTVIVGTDGRRWKLVHDGSVGIQQGGAKADGVTAINGVLNAMLALSDVREITLGKGPYLVDAAVNVVFPPGRTISGIPGAGSAVNIAGAGTPFRLRSLATVTGLNIDCGGHTSGFVFALATSLGGIEYVNLRDMVLYHSKGFLTDDSHASYVATNIRVSSISSRLTKGRGFYLRDVFAFLEMRDVAVDYIGNTAAQNFIAYGIENNEGCLLENCEVTGTTGIVAGTSASQIGYYFGNCKAIYLKRSFADACGGRGFVFTGCQYIRMEQCTASLCDDAGVAVLSSTDFQSTNLYVGGRRGIAGATAGIPGVLINAATRVQLGNTEVRSASGDGVLTAATSTQVVINGGIFSDNGSRGLTTGAGSVSITSGALFVGNAIGNYSIATAYDHIAASQNNAGTFLSVTGPSAG